ncbi:uncharacterized protein [Miscanthus floridulus]|uniref:uncharacterized protein n=1 Tax=Miscanthus floridulus TaxID=154761 RepID=UPI003458A01C
MHTILSKIYQLHRQVQPTQALYIKAKLAGCTSVLMAEAASLAFTSTVTDSLNLNNVNYLSDSAPRSPAGRARPARLRRPCPPRPPSRAAAGLVCAAVLARRRSRAGSRGRGRSLALEVCCSRASPLARAVGGARPRRCSRAAALCARVALQGEVEAGRGNSALAVRADRSRRRPDRLRPPRPRSPRRTPAEVGLHDDGGREQAAPPQAGRASRAAPPRAGRAGPPPSASVAQAAPRHRADRDAPPSSRMRRPGRTAVQKTSRVLQCARSRAACASPPAAARGRQRRRRCMCSLCWPRALALALLVLRSPAAATAGRALACCSALSRMSLAHLRAFCRPCASVRLGE